MLKYYMVQFFKIAMLLSPGVVMASNTKEKVVVDTNSTIVMLDEAISSISNTEHQTRLDNKSNNYRGIFVDARTGFSMASNVCENNSGCNDSSFAYGFSIGYEFKNNVSISFGTENFWPKYKASNTYDFSSINTLQVIGAKEWALGEHWSIGVSAGLVAWQQSFQGNYSVNNSVSHMETGVSPAIGAKVSYRFKNNWQAYGEYKFIHSIGGVETDENIGFIGLRYYWDNSKRVIEIMPTKEIIIEKKVPILSSRPKGSVYFEFDSKELNSESKVILEQWAEYIGNLQSKVTIYITGQADYSGSSTYNKKLSMDRAESVRRYLNENLINEDHISFKVYPLGSEFSENKANKEEMDRRVMISYQYD